MKNQLSPPTLANLANLAKQTAERLKGNHPPQDAPPCPPPGQPPAPVPPSPALAASDPGPAGPCPDCGGGHFWRDSDGWHCSACRPIPRGFQGETLTLPGGRAMDPCPYRIVLDNHAQLIWLPRGLDPAAVVERARQRYGRERVADPGVAPVGGWPRLEDLPADSTPDPAALVEAAIERAAIMEHDGGLSREDADRAAMTAAGMVRCGDCRHFQRNTVGEAEGIGRCLAGCRPPPGAMPFYPNAWRWCDTFQPLENTP